jgi:hypothetical protein
MLGDIPIVEMLKRTYKVGGSQAVQKEVKNTLIRK